MTAATKFVLSSLVIAGTIVVVWRGVDSLQASLPDDMPADAQFLQSGFDLEHNEAKGDWIACRPDRVRDATFCRVTDARGIVIYQGDFLPVFGVQPISHDQLQVVTTGKEKDLWIKGPASAGPVPVIPLANGDMLAPMADSYNLAVRWRNDPNELRRIRSYAVSEPAER